MLRAELPSSEGWPVIWVRSELLGLRQRQTRAKQDLEALLARLTGPRARRRARRLVQQEIDEILDRDGVRHSLEVELTAHEVHTYRQDRPGDDTRFVRRTRKLWKIEWRLDEGRIAYDRKSDGMYPLLTNERALAPKDVFLAHKRQPAIERRFSELKSGLRIAPAFLKNEARIEAFFLVEFLALLVRGLLERDLRRAMEREKVEHLPLYPEERRTRRPTADGRSDPAPLRARRAPRPHRRSRRRPPLRTGTLRSTAPRPRAPRRPGGRLQVARMSPSARPDMASPTCGMWDSTLSAEQAERLADAIANYREIRRLLVQWEPATEAVIVGMSRRNRRKSQ